MRSCDVVVTSCGCGLYGYVDGSREQSYSMCMHACTHTHTHHTHTHKHTHTHHTHTHKHTHTHTGLMFHLLCESLLYPIKPFHQSQPLLFILPHLLQKCSRRLACVITIIVVVIVIVLLVAIIVILKVTGVLDQIAAATATKKPQ